ncbi:transporter substrate-binding domain-containing protein [Pelagibacterium sp. 26DY04]|uniref:transporter substrate-binding domain-containing protein n=1 Tax=Pelagibacterium sp. 26DY04 TaxID=2967130 RepID=UPI002814F291|nr:transporter substrate-binding domain-containing protein [Pelagibacterium sp. 26DY04]WMT85280.1 transporter substrate-binding domain-containing protein [Pelagibacterium sp. 26DY04]
MKSKLIWVIVGVGIASIAVSQAAARSLDEITESGVIRVAVPQDGPPFGMTDANLELVGYDIDMARLVAESLGVDLEMTSVIGANRVPYLTSGRVDIVISSLGRNPERAEVIDFSEQAYAPFFSGVFGPADLEVDSVEDLAGMTVSVARGSIEDLEITEMALESTEIRRFEDGSTTMAAFLSGQVDAVVTANVVAATVLETDPERRPETLFVIADSPCYIGLPKGEPELQARIDEIIVAAKADGTLNAMSERWFYQPIPENL